MNGTLALLLSALLSQSYYSPKEAEELLGQANQAYGKQDYATACEGYRKLLQHGYAGADVRYNLGTCCLAKGELGPAVLELERARREGGAAPDVDANLALARTQQQDQVVGGPMEDGLLARLTAATSDRTPGLFFLALWTVGFGLLCLRRWLKPGVRAAATGAAVASLLLCLPCGLLLAAHVYMREAMHEGVVVARSLSAHPSPQESARSTFEVHAGLRVRVLEDSGSFVHIRLPNGLEGWVERSGVSEI